MNADLLRMWSAQPSADTATAMYAARRTNGCSLCQAGLTCRIYTDSCHVCFNTNTYHTLSDVKQCTCIRFFPGTRAIYKHSIKRMKVKVADTRLPSVWFRSWLAVSLQMTWVINRVVSCHYFPPGPQLPPQPLRGQQPILLLGEERHDGCEQFA